MFPAIHEAVAQVRHPQVQILPGAAAGEGCSIGGSCATCQFMKMNTFESLQWVLSQMGSNEAALEKYKPPKAPALKNSQQINQGIKTNLEMNYFSQNKKLSPEFVKEILN